MRTILFSPRKHRRSLLQKSGHILTTLSFSTSLQFQLQWHHILTVISQVVNKTRPVGNLSDSRIQWKRPVPYRLCWITGHWKPSMSKICQSACFKAVCFRLKISNEWGQQFIEFAHLLYWVKLLDRLKLLNFPFLLWKGGRLLFRWPWRYFHFRYPKKGFLPKDGLLSDWPTAAHRRSISLACRKDPNQTADR